MSSYDEEVRNMWPNAEDRKVRKAALLERLDTYLDTFIEQGQGGGWPDITDQDVEDYSAIMQEIMALKFSRDCDGDRVLNYHIVNRRKARLVSYAVPHSHLYDDEKKMTFAERMQEVRERVRLSSLMRAEAESVARLIDEDIASIMRDQAAEIEKQKLFVDARAKIEAGEDFVEAAKDLYRVLKLDDDGEISTELQALYQEKFGSIFKEESDRVAALVAAANKANLASLGGDPTSPVNIQLVLDARKEVEAGLEKFGMFGFVAPAKIFNNGAASRRAHARKAHLESQPNTRYVPAPHEEDIFVLPLTTRFRHEEKK